MLGSSDDAAADDEDDEDGEEDRSDDHAVSDSSASDSSGSDSTGAAKAAKAKAKSGRGAPAASAAHGQLDKFEPNAFGTLEEHVRSHDYPTHVATCGSCKFWKTDGLGAQRSLASIPCRGRRSHG